MAGKVCSGIEAQAVVGKYLIYVIAPVAATVSTAIINFRTILLFLWLVSAVANSEALYGIWQMWTSNMCQAAPHFSHAEII
jgi:hypothetical protein